jgi:predicted ATPase
LGRKRERLELQKLLTRGELVTLSGAGGSGKTRLAPMAPGRRLGHDPRSK